MKSSNFVLTHASVFAVGIAAAMIVNGLLENEAASSSSGVAANTRASRAGSAAIGSSDGISPTRRSESEEAREATKRSGKAPVEQLADIVRITDPFERQRALMDMIEKLGPGEFADVADRFRELDHLGNSRDEYRLILGRWAKADPLSALEYVNQHGDSRRGREAVLSTWAGNDPAAAEQWALANHEGNGPNPHMPAIIEGVAAHDVNEALRMAQSMPQSEERGEAVKSITRALLLQGIDAAMAFPASVTEAHLRGGFVKEIAERLIQKDVAKAAAWIAAMPDGDIQNRAARDVAGALARADISNAASWVKTLKPEAQVEAARGVIRPMSSENIAATAQWVSTLAGTPNYDRAVEEFVWSCNSRAPEQSAAWIQGMADPAQQRRLYHRMLGEWAQRDATAVKQWVSTNNVPADVLQRFSR
ncbi:MAG: hypothetical protein WEB53_06640 [Akkermansiaceae bacterium]